MGDTGYMDTNKRQLDEHQQHVIDALINAWVSAPQLRFGQLVNEAMAFSPIHLLGSGNEKWAEAFDEVHRLHNEVTRKQQES